MKPVNIGLLGLGTVGGGTATVLVCQISISMIYGQIHSE